MKECPCGSHQSYLSCCGQYLNDKVLPKTAEALMRSRYTAFTLADVQYIKKTMQGKALLGFNEVETSKWAHSVTWLGLKVIAHQDDGDSGTVEFIARFIEKDCVKAIHEVSQFLSKDSHWYYTEGKQINEADVKIARNATCPCGSKKKFKNCHAP